MHDKDNEGTVPACKSSYAALVERYHNRAMNREHRYSQPQSRNHGSSSFMHYVISEWSWARNQMKRPNVFKPFFFLVVMLGLLELSGFSVLSNFSIAIIKTYGFGPKTFVGPETMITLISLSRIPISILSLGVLQNCRKRPLYLFVSGSFLLLVIVIILFSHSVEKGYLTSARIQGSLGLQMVPLLCFMSFYAVYALGYGNIPFTMMGEFFSPAFSSTANIWIFVIINTLELAAVKTALLIKEHHGLQYLFLIPAIAITASAIFAERFMPETHGLTLEEIRNIYSENCEQDEQQNKQFFFDSYNGAISYSSIKRMETGILKSTTQYSNNNCIIMLVSEPTSLTSLSSLSSSF